MSSNNLFNTIKAALEMDEHLHRSGIVLKNVPSLEFLKFFLDEKAQIDGFHVETIQEQLKEVGSRIDTLGKRVATEEDLPRQEKLSLLREIRRLEQEELSRTNILMIRQDNVDTYLTLLHKIGEMESIGTKQLLEPTVDELQVEYEERLGGHEKFVDSLKAFDDQIGYRARVDDSELNALEAKLLEKYNPEKAKTLKEKSIEKSSEVALSPEDQKVYDATMAEIDAMPLKHAVNSPSPVRELENKKILEEETLKSDEGVTEKISEIAELVENSALRGRVLETTNRVASERSAFEDELEKAIAESREKAKKEAGYA